MDPNILQSSILPGPEQGTTLNPKPQILNPKPSALNPEPKTLNPKLSKIPTCFKPILGEPGPKQKLSKVHIWLHINTYIGFMKKKMESTIVYIHIYIYWISYVYIYIMIIRQS